MAEILIYSGKTWFKVLALALLTALTVIVLVPSGVMAQLPSLNPVNPPLSLPAGVQQVGNLEVTDITLDGNNLLKVASPTVFDRTAPTNLPVEVRARQIEANLNRLVPDSRSQEPMLNPENLEVIIETIDGYPVLFALVSGIYLGPWAGL
jgi:small conductance mechanosensitive channel